MKVKPPIPIIRALIIALIVAVIGWIGLDVPRSAIEETVDAQLDEWQGGERAADAGATSVAASAARVTNVIDGDTVAAIVDDEVLRLRFIGIDTPETEYAPAGLECYEREATARARELLADTTIRITTDPTQALRDVNGRLLVYATLSDGRDFGEVMLAEGFAREYTYAADYEKQTQYKTAELNARENNLGLWSDCVE